MDTGIWMDNLNVTLLWAMKFNPKNIKGDVKGRKQHSFLYVCEGTYRFSFEKESFLAHAGDVVYIPKGSRHQFEVIDQKAVCYQSEFEIGQPDFRFSPFPFKLEESKENVELIVDMVYRFNTGLLSDHLAALGYLCRLCSVLAGQIHENTKKKSRIRPAIEYLETHCHEKVEISTLAELCHLSLSQLRRHFANELHATPTAYKNSLRIEKAKRILCNEDVSIGEIAQRLGFENIYVFSNTFKKYAGLSPTQFASNLKNH
jgi:AraC-like DNA-binding protein